MANQDITYTPDPDADSISSDVTEFNGILMSTQIPTRADGSLELGDVTAQSECTLQALKVALEKAGSSMDRVLHLTIYLTDMADRSDTDMVSVMTLHAAKGLEFDTVFLVGWEEGLFPSQRAIDEGGTASLEEERRLAYVAITRARRRAVILHAANRRIYGQWTSSIPSRFVGELPDAHIEAESSMSGGESLWRANWSEHADPFSTVGRGTGRGPGWQRAAGTGSTFTTAPSRVVESRASAISLGNKGRSDLSVGQRVFHQKFGYGEIAEIEGNKLEIDFEQAGRKRVMDSFVSLG